nr:MAG TPA: Putative amidoligase enzyme [Bacteriophage sp.]
MEIRFNVTGSKRKELATIISEVIGQKLVYKGMPSAAYEVADITISKDGTVTYDERTENDIIKAIIEKAGVAGFSAKASAPTEFASPEASTDATEADIVASASSTGLVVSFPADKVNLENLQKLLESKATLIKKALGVEAFPIEEHNDQVSFPWWPTMPDFDAITAYTSFLAALCKMSKEQKRITAKEKLVENEKYAFRCFLLRLGFIGDEYKQSRRILCRYLCGNSSYAGGEGHVIR